MKRFKDIQRLNEKAQALNEATPGKAETMAQKHARMQGYTGNPDDEDQGRAYRSQKQFLAFVREVAKDWHSGDMALSRMQSLITSELWWLMHGPATSDSSDPDVPKMKALSQAFRKRVKAAGLEPTSRLGDAGGWKGSAMGKITPNQIGRYFDLVVDFVQNDWPKISKA